MSESIWIDISGNNLVMTVVAFACGLLWLIQMIWFWGIFAQLAFFTNRPASSETPPVSVVIAARNEYYNLMRNLQAILEQDYPSFEVVLVNDASDDETEDFLKGMVLKYPHLNVVSIRSELNRHRGKKFPLALGIKAARHEILVLTDADCMPASPQWLRHMVSEFSDKISVVLGYGGYSRSKGLLNTLIRWETVHIAMQYFGHALAGQPYMGVGRNLAYRKSLFMQSGGFASHYHLSGGDDDLFVNHQAKGRNTRICVHPDARTLSTSARGWSFWLRQKRRHLSTGFYYRFKHQLLLGLWSFSQLAFPLTAVFLILNQFNILPVAILLFLRLMSQLIIFKKSMQKLSEKNLLLFSPVFEAFFIIFNFLVAVSDVIKRKQQWK